MADWTIRRLGKDHHRAAPDCGQTILDTRSCRYRRFAN
jgi:hypothetical protein